MTQPAPFEIAQFAPGAPRPVACQASNGTLTIASLDDDAKIFRRRGITGSISGPPALVLLPQVNELAGLLLANPNMPGAEILQRLETLQAQCIAPAPQNTEWAFVQLGDVNVYTDGSTVVVTRKDLAIGQGS